VTFREDPTQQALQNDGTVAGVVQSSGTQLTRLCPEVEGGPPPTFTGSWLVNGTTVMIPNSESIGATLSDGGTGSCLSVDTLQKM
jgi:hypothetical protein